MSIAGPAGLADGVGVALGEGVGDPLAVAVSLGWGTDAGGEVAVVLSLDDVHAARSRTAVRGTRRRRMQSAYVAPGNGRGTDR